MKCDQMCDNGRVIKTPAGALTPPGRGPTGLESNVVHRIAESDRGLLESRLLARRQIDVNGCWLWMAARSSFGYGRMRWHWRDQVTHRLSAHLWLGLDLDDPSQQACHHCDNPRCFNPEHLYVGTQAQNMRDRVARGHVSDHDQRGSANPNARLTWTQVRSIRDEYATGRVTQQEIADRFGIARGYVSQLVRHRKWQDAA